MLAEMRGASVLAVHGRRLNGLALAGHHLNDFPFVFQHLCEREGGPCGEVRQHQPLVGRRDGLVPRGPGWEADPLRDGRREEFDRQKLRSAILKSVAKRPVAIQQIDEIVNDIEARLHERSEKEISSDEVGRAVMERLEKLDQVAYIRFASVYRKFQDVSQFTETVDRLRGLLKDQKAKPPGRPRPLARTK